MTYQNLEKWYSRSIKMLLFVVPFLPLYIASGMLFPFITGRNFAFRIIIEIAFALWLPLVALSKEYRPHLSPIMKAVLVFLGVVFCADLFGVDFYKSFWANYERMEGFLMISHMALFFVMTASVFRLKDWKTFFHLIIAGSLGVGGYALFQWFGILRSIQGGERVDGTIGNPAYLAAYLMLVLISIGILYWNETNRLFKRVYAGIALFNFFIIYQTATRGALLALLGGAFLFLLLYVWMGRNDAKSSTRWRIALGLLGAVIILPVMLWGVRNTPFIQSSNTLARLTSISLNDQTTESRFLIWKMALKGIHNRPLLGWGQENFNLVFNKYFEPKLWKQEPWFDRSHDIIFDWLSNAGIVGLVSYLALFGAAFYTIWRAYRKNALNRLPAITLVAGLSAYFAQNIFVFDNFNSYFIFFGIMAHLHFIDWNGREIQPHSQKLKGTFTSEIQRSISVFIAMFFVAIVAVYFLNLRPLFQARDLISTLRLINAGAPPKMVLESFQKTFSHRTFGDRETAEQFAQYGGNIVYDEKVPAEEKKRIIGEVLKELEKIVADFPDDVRYRLFLASSGYMTATALDQKYTEKAEQEFLKALEMSPTKQMVYLGLIQLYYSLGRYDKMFEFAEKGYNLDHSFPEGQLFYTIAAIYTSQFSLAEKLLAEHKELHIGKTFLAVANAYAGIQKYDAMIPIYKELIERFPKIAQYHANIAAVYVALGQKELARSEVAEAVRLDPEKFGKDAESFLKQLGQ